MDVTIIGTGNMARRIGTRLVAGSHDVTVLGKDPGEAEAVVKELAGQGSAKAGRSGDAIADAVVVLAVYYPDAKAAVEQYGGGLSGKVLIDITNPVNETFDGFVTPPDSSAAQELARSATGARVVKAFNTTFAGTLVEGQVAGQRSTCSSRAMTARPRPSSRNSSRTAGCALSTRAHLARARAGGGRPAAYERAGCAGHGFRQLAEDSQLVGVPCQSLAAGSPAGRPSSVTTAPISPSGRSSRPPRSWAADPPWS